MGPKEWVCTAPIRRTNARPGRATSSGSAAEVADAGGSGVRVDLRIYVYPNGNGWFYHIDPDRKGKMGVAPDGAPVNSKEEGLEVIEDLWDRMAQMARGEDV